MGHLYHGYVKQPEGFFTPGNLGCYKERSQKSVGEWDDFWQLDRIGMPKLATGVRNSVVPVLRDDIPVEDPLLLGTP